jgi:Spy/CpxP family protein refolding chaperone
MNIINNSYQRIVPILTPEQQKKVATGLKSRQRLASILKSLNLTPSQNIKINPIITDYKKQILAVLTPEQKKKIEALAPKK